MSSIRSWAYRREPLRASAVLGLVSPEGQDAAHPGVQQLADDLGQFRRGVAHAGQVGQRPEGGLQHEPVDEFDGGVPVGAAGTVRDGHVVGLCGLQFRMVVQSVSAAAGERGGNSS